MSFEIQTTLPSNGVIEITNACTPDNPADFVLVDTTIDGDNRETIYQSMLGEPETAAKLRVGRYFNPKARSGKGTTNVSMKMEFYAREVLNGEEVGPLEPCSVVLAYSVPGPSLATTEEAKIGKLISLLTYWMVHGPEDQGAMPLGYDRIHALGFGITEILSI